MFLTLGTYAVPEFRVGSGSLAVPYAVPLSVVLIVFVSLDAVKRRGTARLAPGLVVATYGYFLSVIVSLLVSKELNVVLAIKYALMAFLPLLASLIAVDEKSARVALACAAITGVGVLAYGAYGFFTGRTGDPLEHTLGYFGVTYTESTRNSDVLYFQATFWLLLAYLYPNLRRRRTVTVVVLSLLLLALLGAIILSLSRGAWVAGLITPLLLLVIWNQSSVRISRRAVWLVLMLGFGIVVGIYVVPQEWLSMVVARWGSLFTLSPEGGNSNAARVALINEVLEICAAHPLLGVGVGNLRYYLVDFQFGAANHAENVYLQALAEQGLLGLVSLLGIMFWVGACLVRAVRYAKAADGITSWILLGLVINWAVYGLFNSLLDNMWFWALLSLAAAYGNWFELQKTARNNESVLSRFGRQRLSSTTNVIPRG